MLSTQEKALSNQDRITLNIHEMSFTSKGVDNFMWPISVKERNEFSYGLMADICLVLNNPIYPQKDLHPFRLMGKYIISEAAGLFQAELALKRFQEAGVTHISVPYHWRYWPTLIGKGELSPTRIIDVIARNKAKSFGTLYKKKNRKYLDKIIRIFNFLVTSPLKLKRITPSVLRDDIISLQKDSFIDAHAAMTPDDVVYLASDRWFSPIPDNELNNKLTSSNKNLTNEILDCIEKSYKKYDLTLHEKSRNYYSALIKKGATLFAIHYERLSTQALPRRVWTGTGGNVWDMMIRLAVLENGGKAVGHDHGTGAGHIVLPQTAFTELWGCTEFYTFTKAHAEGLKKQDLRYSYSYANPAIKYVYPASKKAKGDTKIFSSPVKTIAVMVTLYDGDVGRMGPGYSDIFLVDWQVRLISRLSEWGYNVIMKVHPESRIALPDHLKNIPNVTLVSTALEDIKEPIDLLLFNCIYTTAFKVAIKAGYPILLIEQEEFAWTNEAKELIEKRVTILKAGIDPKTNRAAINWDNLKAAIDCAPSKVKEAEFRDAYYGW